MSFAANPRANRLLAALPQAELRCWLPQLEWVALPLGQVLYESGMSLSHAYFPTSAIIPLLYVTQDGATSEIAVVGNEGVVGIPLLMGGKSTTSRAMVQVAGEGFRIKAQALKDALDRSGPVKDLLLRYTMALMTETAQTAVCNRHHTVDQHLCRWLLQSLDRLQGKDIVITQELIAHMLGVRREGVTDSALKLQKAGLISYTRGHIRVLDREGLEKRVCECYAVVKKEYARLLPETLREVAEDGESRLPRHAMDGLLLTGSPPDTTRRMRLPSVSSRANSPAVM